jgi:hypothetical protein
MYLGGDLIEDPGQVLAGRVPAQHLGDEDLVVETGRRLLHADAEGLGVVHGEIERREVEIASRSRRRPSLVLVSVDADGQDVQLRLDLVRGSRELHGDARRRRGQQVLAVVGDHLDDVVAGIERQLLGEGVHITATLGLRRHGGGDAVDAPLDAADAATVLLVDGRLDFDELGGRGRA